MLNIGLSASDTNLYYKDLASPHEVRIKIRIMKTDHTPIASNISGLLIDGQIDGQLVEVDRRSIRLREFDDPCILHTLSMTLLDPGFTLRFDSTSPDDAALYMDRMVQVIRSDFCPSLNEWVDCPMFIGPITDLNRDGALVMVTAQSKESLAAHQANRATTLAGRITDIIRTMLGWSGETRMDIPNLEDKSSRRVTVVRESMIFSKAYYLARSLTGNKDLFYDARGQAKFTGDGTVVFRFDGTNILSQPGRSYGTADLINTVRVVVGGGGGETPKFDVTASLPSDHPNSAQRLGRRNLLGVLEPQWRLLTVYDDEITTLEAANARAQKELLARSTTVVGSTFTALCVPPLELGDRVTVTLDGKVDKQRVSAFSKPLTVDGVMSVGQTTLVSRPVRGAAA